ncbi:MarR family winged helix-turn-helix transcriptional regulator [Mycobacterium sp. 1245805.9]|uniref:MarR family winged helix-turn-helix transcriptional regulator n=1 Tax=Mycobacterium sp. 1245805.9 TaxID=1856862 RepID=UPI0012E9ABFD|nr:MarR family transcriptional regulator [Mycobacterium sp. 1245805.9]
MDERDREQLINWVAAAALAISDAVYDSLEASTRHDRSAAVALVALADLAHAGSVQSLCSMLGLSHSGCVRIVDRLARDGLVDRAPGADGRTRSLVLTLEGRRLALRLRQARRDAVAATLSDLSGEQGNQLRAISRAIVTTSARDRLERRRRGEPPSGGWLCRLCDASACGRDIGQCPAANAADDP